MAIGELNSLDKLTSLLSHIHRMSFHPNPEDDLTSLSPLLSICSHILAKCKTMPSIPLWNVVFNIVCCCCSSVDIEGMLNCFSDLLFVPANSLQAMYNTLLITKCARILFLNDISEFLWSISDRQCLVKVLTVLVLSLNGDECRELLLTEVFQQFTGCSEPLTDLILMCENSQDEEFIEMSVVVKRVFSLFNLFDVNEICECDADCDKEFVSFIDSLLKYKEQLYFITNSNKEITFDI
ncbi:hypothetical protein GEMRC1_008548 [Eukaryota sp. GEM-RC1]